MNGEEIISEREKKLRENTTRLREKATQLVKLSGVLNGYEKDIKNYTAIIKAIESMSLDKEVLIIQEVAEEIQRDLLKILTEGTVDLFLHKFGDEITIDSLIQAFKTHPELKRMIRINIGIAELAKKATAEIIIERIKHDERILFSEEKTTKSDGLGNEQDLE